MGTAAEVGHRQSKLPSQVAVEKNKILSCKIQSRHHLNNNLNSTKNMFYLISRMWSN
jgi:hypothetical protein